MKPCHYSHATIVLFVLGDAKQESTGFIPSDLVYGHEVRGPLRMLKEKWLGNEDTPNILKYVTKLKKIMRARETVSKKLRVSRKAFPNL